MHPKILFAVLLVLSLTSVADAQKSGRVTKSKPARVQAIARKKDVPLSPQMLYEEYRHSIVRIVCDERMGTGFFIKNGSTVITSYHVLEGTEHIDVQGSKGEKWTASRAWFDPDADLAVLELSAATGRKPIRLAQFDAVKPGGAVTVISHALGFLTDSVSTGVVSARRLDEGVPLVQFSAAVSPGSSGGPVLDDRGQAVGVVQSSLTEGNSLNLAIATPAVHKLLAKEPGGLEEFYQRGRELRKELASIEESRQAEQAADAERKTREAAEVARLEADIEMLQGVLDLEQTELRELLTKRASLVDGQNKWLAYGLSVKRELEDTQRRLQGVRDALGTGSAVLGGLAGFTYSRLSKKRNELEKNLQKAIEQLTAHESAIQKADSDLEVRRVSVAVLISKLNDLRAKRSVGG